jgi:hypothetical protein
MIYNPRSDHRHTSFNSLSVSQSLELVRFSSQTYSPIIADFAHEIIGSLKYYWQTAHQPHPKKERADFADAFGLDNNRRSSTVGGPGYPLHSDRTPVLRAVSPVPSPYPGSRDDVNIPLRSVDSRKEGAYSPSLVGMAH